MQLDKATNIASITRREIANGYGVEDIAVMHDLPLDCVRQAVSNMRESGELGRIFSPKKGAAT